MEQEKIRVQKPKSGSGEVRKGQGTRRKLELRQAGRAEGTGVSGVLRGRRRTARQRGENEWGEAAGAGREQSFQVLTRQDEDCEFGSF